MKYAILLAAALSVMLAGATCLPLFELDPTDDVSADIPNIGVSITQPGADQTVKKGDLVLIEWSASNLTDEIAYATVYVRAIDDFSETILDGGHRITQSPGKQTFYWNTGDAISDFSGEYSVHVKMEVGDETSSDEAAGRITVNTPPFFEFTVPVRDVTFEKGDPEDPNDPNSPLADAEIEIAWNSSDIDSDGVAEIGLDPDSGDLSHDSGNEIVIYEATIPRTLGEDQIDWDGKDVDGELAPAGRYTLYAKISDDVNDETIVQALDKDGELLRITVPETITNAITVPDEDVSIVYGNNDRMGIRYVLDEDVDVFLDFRVDPDENHENGNETTIKSRIPVSRNIKTGIINWDGYYAVNETSSSIVGIEGKGGLFRMLMIVDSGAANAQTIESEGFFFVRETDDTPVIALTAPISDITMTEGSGGNFIVKWRDDDPTELAGIRLVIDDDAIPNQGTETDGPEQVLEGADFADLDAADDGVSDTYRYYVQDDLDQGRYWIFAYIDRDGAAPWDCIAVAAGQLIVEDVDETP